MHYLGIRQTLELYRNGVKINDLAIDNNFKYDNPEYRQFETPIEVRPGDEIRTQCHFNSRGKNVTTQFGAATSDEMCFSFMSFYPKRAARIRHCVNWRTVDICRYYAPGPYDGCDWRNFGKDAASQLLFASVLNNCDSLAPCTSVCLSAVQAIEQHPCGRGDVWEGLKDSMANNPALHGIVKRVQNCRCGVSPNVTEVVPASTPGEVECGWESLRSQLKHPAPNHPLFSILSSVVESCRPSQCFEECIPAVMNARRHPCFQGDEWNTGRDILFKNGTNFDFSFLLLFDSCNCEIANVVSATSVVPPVGTGAPTTGNALLLGLTVLAVLITFNFM